MFAWNKGGLYRQWYVETPVITIRVPVRYLLLAAERQKMSGFTEFKISVGQRWPSNIAQSVSFTSNLTECVKYLNINVFNFCL